MEKKGKEGGGHLVHRLHVSWRGKEGGREEGGRDEGRADLRARTPAPMGGHPAGPAGGVKTSRVLSGAR